MTKETGKDKFAALRQQAEEILENGQADLIALGREALVDPMWALHAARTLGQDTLFETWPQQSGWWLAVRQKTSDFYDPDAID